MSLHLIPERQAFVPPCCCSCYDINIPLLNTDLWLPQAPLFICPLCHFSSASRLQFSNSGFLQFLIVICLPPRLFAGEDLLVISGSHLFYNFCMFMHKHFRSALNHPTFSREVRKPLHPWYFPILCKLCFLICQISL